jgi:hypothetical protein
VQPIHLTFDAPSVRALFPQHLDRAYRLRDLLDAGAPLAFGSDTPVASPDVVAGLRAAVARLGVDGEPLGADQALTVAEALHAYTAGAAHAIGREGRSGVLRVGADADVVLLSHDPHDGLDGLEVVATILGGVVHPRPGRPRRLSAGPHASGCTSTSRSRARGPRVAARTSTSARRPDRSSARGRRRASRAVGGRVDRAHGEDRDGPHAAGAVSSSTARR